MSLRELQIRAEAMQLDRWDRTAGLVSAIHNLTCLVHNGLGGKPQMKGKPLQAFHPLRSQSGQQATEKLRITRENFHVLKQIFVPGSER